jgi:hypothetical protein
MRLPVPNPIANLAKAVSGLGRWVALPIFALSVATTAKSFRGNPVIGSATLNRWGLHVARKRLAAALGQRRRRRLAGLIPDSDRAAFDRDGFIVKPNFLDDATFRAVRNEILDLEVAAREAIIGDAMTRLIPIDVMNAARLPTVKSVLESSSYRGLLAYVGAFRRTPNVYVQTVFSRVCEGEPDIQSSFHSDTFHPTVKSWLFLEDVPDDATPFTYVPGSHRLNRRRLAWERRMSITAAHSRDVLTAEGSLRISEREIKRLGYGPARRFPVAANTLIVADTSGIHARAPAPGKSSRVSIWAYSRSNPFLPWSGFDFNASPAIKKRALMLYWAASDGWKDMTGSRRAWRWVGKRTPLSPPGV